MPPEPDNTIAVVLAGGGARGAYEIGALSVVLPALAARGERPAIILGTSVGALNAAWLAANAHRDTDELVATALTIWPGIRFEDVLRPLVTVGAGARIARYLAGAALGHGRLDALLDPAPLTSTIERLIAFDDLAANAAEGRVTLAVAATGLRTGRTVVFVAGRGAVPGEDLTRGITYVKPARLTGDHVRASAAIPTAFPAVYVDDGAAPGWYVDGGTRMNTPIKPALALGAGRLVVIGLNGTDPGPAPPAEDRDTPPDAFEGAAQIAQGLLADPLAADIRTLAATNELLAGAPGDAATGGKTPKPYIFVAPARRDAIGELARTVYADHFERGGFRAPGRDLTLLGRLIGAGRSATHGELFSYLCFARELADALIARGRADAQQWLAGEHDDGPWRIGRLPGEAPAPRR
jgi:NTE family protein